MKELELIPISGELTPAEVPMYLSRVAAGFPAEAYNYTEDTIDFNQLLIISQETTFCMRVNGDSMSGDGINAGDLLVIDKLEEPREGDILIFSVNGEFTMKRLKYCRDHVELISSNPKYPPILIKEGEELQRWGVVTHVIKDFR